MKKFGLKLNNFCKRNRKRPLQMNWLK